MPIFMSNGNGLVISCSGTSHQHCGARLSPVHQDRERQVILREVDAELVPRARCEAAAHRARRAPPGCLNRIMQLQTA